MMQSPEAQYQLALKMPMNRLMGILQGKPDAVVGQPIAMMALQSLKEQKTAAQGMQAQQQLQQPNIKDQLLAEDQGIAVASAPNMNAVVNAAHGGIVGYDSGGAGGGMVSFTDGGGVRRFAEKDGDQLVQAPTLVGKKWDDLPRYDPKKDLNLDTSGGFDPVMRSLGIGQYANPERYRIDPTTGNRISIGEFLRKQEANPAVQPVAQANAPGQPAPGPQPAPGLRVQTAPRPRVQTAPVPDPNFITQEDAAPQAAPAMPPAQRPQQAQYERPDWLNTMDRFSGSQKYSDEMTETLKQLTDTAEEKSSKKDTALGTTFLKAARAALQPGKTGSGALGDIFGELASGAEQYKKEESADKKAMLGAKMSMLGAQAQLMQNNEKAAGDQYRHGETLALQAGQYAYDNAFKQEEIKLKGQQISDEDKYRMAQVAGDRAKNKITSDWYEMHRPLINAQATYHGNRGAGGVTPAKYAEVSARLSADITRELDSPAGGRIRNSPEYKGKSEEFIRANLLKQRLLTAFPNAGGAQEERSSFQRDDRRPGTPLAPELP